MTNINPKIIKMENKHTLYSPNKIKSWFFEKTKTLISTWINWRIIKNKGDITINKRNGKGNITKNLSHLKSIIYNNFKNIKRAKQE